MQALEEKLQYHFKNPALLEEALRHSSYANEHRGANFFSNERLEFLGDSVLGFVTAEYLFAKHPTAPEGELTRIRALLVCEDSLHEVELEAAKIGEGKKHFSLLQSCVCIKFDLQNAIFKFSVVDNTDIFDADLFCCKDGCDGCNGTGPVHCIGLYRHIA